MKSKYVFIFLLTAFLSVGAIKSFAKEIQKNPIKKECTKDSDCVTSCYGADPGRGTCVNKSYFEKQRGNIPDLGYACSTDDCRDVGTKCKCENKTCIDTDAKNDGAGCF
jgi:hypothetical protein